MRIRTGVGVVEVEYKVRFEKYTPKASVYSTDLGVFTRKDVFVSPTPTVDFGEDIPEDPEIDPSLLHKAIVSYHPHIPTTKDAPPEETESELVERARANRVTLIKVERSEHVDPVARAYRELYIDQLTLEGDSSA